METSYKEAFKHIKDKNIEAFHMLVGFDAVIDHLVHVVKHRDEHGKASLFSTIDEFGDYLKSKAGMSCCLELKTITKKMGGNMAILSQAAAALGISVSSIGTAGRKDDFVHESLAQCSDVYSVAEPGYCTALEFKDGKVMLSDSTPLQVTWNDIVSRVGAEQLANLITRSDMLCLVNWSEVFQSNEIWRKILRISEGFQRKKWVFFDLADLSCRPKTEILECVSLISDYSVCFKNVLGLNENEMYHLAGILGLEKKVPIAEIGFELQKRTNTEILVVHTNTCAYSFDRGGRVYKGSAFVCENPVTLTGGGDNFNAGFCLGLLMGLDMDGCLLLGNAASGYYVRNGRSADFNSLKTFISSHEDIMTDMA